MTAAELATRLCSDLVQRVAEFDGRPFVVTSFLYPDGDSVIFYVDDQLIIGDDGSAFNISDHGITLFKCRESGVEITPPRKRFIEQVCGDYEIEFENGILTKRVSVNESGAGALRFCEAISRISSLEYDPTSRNISSLPDRVHRLLLSRVQPIRPVLPKWYDERIDPKKSHPVDFRVNGDGEACNIFVVTSEEKCTVVAAVSHYFQSKEIWVPTLSIIDPRNDIGDVFMDRLGTASTKVISDARGHEDEIVRFALAGATKDSSN